MFSTSSKSARVTGQTTYPGISVRDSVAMNHMEGSLSTSGTHCADSAQVEHYATTLSMYHSFIGDLESMNAYHAKEENEKLNNQCGFEINEKIFKRKDYETKMENERKTRQRQYYDCRVMKKMGIWRKKYNHVRNNSMETIFEASFEPHFGLESLSATTFAIDALAKFANIDIPDRVLREVEGVILLLVNLTQQSTALGVITSILSWVQGRTSKSLFKSIKDFLEELLVSPQSSTTPDWLECLRDIQQNWELCKIGRAHV